MRKILLIALSLFLALVGWSPAGADDDFYVIPTMKSNYAPVPKTGQTRSLRTGDDGDWEKGVAWPTSRFIDNANGTVTDKLTGLIWMKNANAFGFRSWVQALIDANCMASDSAGLTDGSEAGDWRLPNIRELQSLLDYGRFAPTLPVNHPFTGVQLSYYWSSTTIPDYAYDHIAYIVDFGTGIVQPIGKSDTYGVWCVRGGK